MIVVSGATVSCRAKRCLKASLHYYNASHSYHDPVEAGSQPLRRGGERSRVPQPGNLRERFNLINFGALSSEIVGIQAMGGAFGLFFTFNYLVFMEIP